MFSDIARDIKAQLYERARSPLPLTFVGAWLVINIRTVLVFFSELHIDEKIVYFEKANPTLGIWLVHSLVYPLISAAIVLAVYPHLARLTYWYWQTQHMRIKEIQQKIEDKTPLTQEEANTLRKTFLVQQLNLESQLSSSSTRNAELQKQIEDLKELLSTVQIEKQSFVDELAKKKELIKILEAATNLNSKNNDLNKTEDSKKQDKRIKVEGVLISDDVASKLTDANLDGESIQLFALFIKREGRSHIGTLFNQFSGARKVNMEHALEKLKTYGFISSSSEGALTLTQKGRDLAVSSGLTHLLAT